MHETAWQWRPQGVADLLDNTFKVYRDRFGLFFAINAAVLVPFALVQNLLLSRTPLSLFEQLSGAAPAEAELLVQQFMLSFDWGQFMLAQILFLVLTLFVWGLQTTATMWATNAHLHGHAPDVGTSFGGGLRYLLRAVGVRLLLSVMFMVVVFTVVFASVVFGIFGGPFLAMVLFFGGIVCFGIFVGLRWLLVIPASIAEEADFGRAVTRSYELSRGALAALLGRYLLFLLLIAVLTIVPSLVIGALVDLIPLLSLQLRLALTGLAGALVGAVVQPLGPIMLMLLYYDRRVRKEGYDLQQQAAELSRDV